MKIKNKNVFAVWFMVVAMLMAGCQQAEPEPVPVVEEQVIDEMISIYVLGDNLLHTPVIASGLQEDGSYDFSHIFANLQPEIRNADMAVIGQETIYGGDNLGYSGYPLFNSPTDMGRTLVKEGFDTVLHASNHVLDKGGSGVENTLAFWQGYPEINVLGINSSEEEKQKVDIVEVKGAKLALLNYTYGTNGLSVPMGKEYLVNYIDEEKIKTDAEYSEENADFTIAFMHWGTEYSSKPDEAQKALALKMCEWGVDLIVGSHPHVIEPVEWIESENGNKMLVYYSLGNFVSRQVKAANLLGGIADVELHYNGEAVDIEDFEFVPIVTHYDVTHTQFAVYPLAEYTNELAAGHGVAGYNGAVSIERWTEMIRSTFEGYDTSMIKDIEL